MYEDLYCELAKFGHLLELHVSILRLPTLLYADTRHTSRSATTSGITLLETCTRVMSGRRKLKLLLTT